MNKLKEAIIKAVPDIITKFKEEECITESIGCFIRQSSQETGREYEYERPITLADVLIALEKNNRAHEIFITADGYFYEIVRDIDDGETQEIRMIDVEWNLENNSLDEQSDETKKYLEYLINK